MPAPSAINLRKFALGGTKDAASTITGTRWALAISQTCGKGIDRREMKGENR